MPDLLEFAPGCRGSADSGCINLPRTVPDEPDQNDDFLTVLINGYSDKVSKKLMQLKKLTIADRHI
jgi:hypothetical protein